MSVQDDAAHLTSLADSDLSMGMIRQANNDLADVVKQVFAILGGQHPRAHAVAGQLATARDQLMGAVQSIEGAKQSLAEAAANIKA
jgi:hypothetical protein